MIPKARMPEPTSKASDPRATTETAGPPVSGSGADTDAEAEALAVAEAVAEALAAALASSPKLTSGRSLA